MSDDVIPRIIGAYRSRLVRAYCWGRFRILRQRFLVEIGQYLPEQGRVLDIGCGFGLFSLFYALSRPDLSITGLDLNERRIELAQQAAARLGLSRVQYRLGDARSFQGGEERYDAAYLLDVIHHIPRERVRPLLEEVHRLLPEGGRLLIKDVGTRPHHKRLFTLALDLAMDSTWPHYWPTWELTGLLTEVGFSVFRHPMVDYLPYPHELYICQKTPTSRH